MICVADNSNHNENITFKFAAAAATLVTDQVVLVLQCSGLTTEASLTLCVHPVIPDSELKMIKVIHITHQDRATPAMCRQYEVHATPLLLLITSHHHVSQGLIHWTLLHAVRSAMQ